MQEFNAIFIFLILSLFLGLSMIILSVFAAPKTENHKKQQIYECGMDISQVKREKINLQFLTYAICFLIFGIEIIFIFPFAVSLDVLGLFAIVEIMIFIMLLLFGLFYIIAKRVLRFK